MKKRNYLKVTSKLGRFKQVNLFTMKETRLINTVVKDMSSNGKCEVELIECTQDEYDNLF
jgi:hypothetical protein|tara:strand:+ start:709 stop:888 length:180 start_codon:yes stop_codon:yes gene_type:complete